MIELNKEIITDHIAVRDWQFCVHELKENFKLNADKKIEEPSESTLNIVVDITTQIKAVIKVDTSTDDDLFLLLKQCFQSLRNSASFDSNKQSYIIDKTDVLINVEYYVDYFVNVRNNLTQDCFKMCLQFLINSVVNNADTQLTVWTRFSNTLISLIKTPNISFLCSALIYNILVKNPDLLLATNQTFVDDILCLLQSENDDEIFYYNEIVQLLVVNNILTDYYENLIINKRIQVLEITRVILIADKVTIHSDQFIKKISSQFKSKSDCILKTVTDYLNQIEPQEVALLLDCLASASAKLHYQKVLQEDKSLLINCIYLLKSIHSLGQRDLNNFSAIDKISELPLIGKTVEEHPGFGFKANLVRILGNLASQHEANQNELRELECIPLLLDCCKIDGRNPLITQWAIFAIHNLCEKNTANQNVIRELQLQGVVNSATLLQMGISLHTDGANSIGIVPLDAIKK